MKVSDGIKEPNGGALSKFILDMSVPSRIELVLEIWWANTHETNSRMLYINHLFPELAWHINTQWMNNLSFLNGVEFLCLCHAPFGLSVESLRLLFSGN